jgi:hypothetical protein
VDGSLPIPDTWEVAITAAGKDETKKRAEWTRLLEERKLGGFALIRNLRNLQAAKVADKLIRSALSDMKPDRILPFRFLAAVRHAPTFAAELESAMFKNLADQPHFDGTMLRSAWRLRRGSCRNHAGSSRIRRAWWRYRRIAAWRSAQQFSALFRHRPRISARP